MTVFVMWRGEYDSRRIVAIYSTHEKAQEEGEAGAGRQKYERSLDFDIEEFTLDEVVPDWLAR